MIKTEYIYNAVVTRVIDGDTIDASVDLGFTVHVDVRFRLNGINTAELRDSDPVKAEAAQRAKKFIIDACLNKEITLKSYKTDKYGRWLADVFVNGVSVNRQLLNEGLAVVYKD